MVREISAGMGNAGYFAREIGGEIHTHAPCRGGGPHPARACTINPEADPTEAPANTKAALDVHDIVRLAPP